MTIRLRTLCAPLMPSRSSRFTALALFAAAFLCAVTSAAAKPQPPNILFVIMDDVGIDQMQVFGYGGETPPATPTIDTIANSGVRFHNAWSMPACSASRSVFFVGRYPLRTSTYTALGPSDLANSMVSPFEMTTPKLLKMRNYQSALFGKFHLGLQGNSPFGYAMPLSLGWDYFYGWLDETGDPSSIDTTAGGVAETGTWSCGFVRGAKGGGADTGACYFGDDSCKVMVATPQMPPGRACRDAGGILDPGQVCKSPRPSNIEFSNLSAHYVSPLYINVSPDRVEQVLLTDQRARTWRDIVAVDAAIDWINSRPGDRPWMVTVSFAGVHTPVMQPPLSEIPPDSIDTNDLDCANTNLQRILTNQMLEALDKQLGRLLTATGLAHRAGNGRLIYNPEPSDTMIVIVGDNGTLGYTVKEPFDPTRAKGTTYQTGVWVPLVVAGPLVRSRDREVSAMVNIADIFELFGEVAGIDVHKAVPRTIDSKPMLPYLLNPKQDAIRTLNFTQVGPNIQANGGYNGPCVLANSCSQIPPTQSVCEDNLGTWYGADDTRPPDDPIPPQGFKFCCNVNQYLAQQGQPTVTIQPLSSRAMRNETYKLVTNFTKEYSASAADGCRDNPTDEFYEINEEAPDPRIDRENLNLLKKPKLSPEEQANYDALKTALDTLLASQPECLGDGNIDGVVNGQDLIDYAAMRALSHGGSSWYDFNRDGSTDNTDLAIILKNLGTQCPQ